MLDERIVRAEPVEQRHRDLAQPLALLGACSGHGLDDEPQRAFDVAGVERGDDARELAGARELLDQGVGAGRREQLVEERVDGRRATARPANSATTLPSRNALTAGMPLTETAARGPGWRRRRP